MRRRRRGAALLIVLALLGVLAILLASMARLTTVERSAARSRVHQTAARAAAEAGVAHATAALRHLATLRATDGRNEDWAYRGEDHDGDGVPSGLHEESFASGEFDVLDCPVEYALHPSLPLTDGGLPVVVGRTGISGRLPDGAVYTLKILDCAAQLDVNDGLGDPDRTARLAARIDRLWLELAARSMAAPAATDPGSHLLDRRPADGFADEPALRTALVDLDPADPSLGEEVFRRLAPHLTCHPWRDPNALEPRGADRGPIEPDGDVLVDGRWRYEALPRTARAPVDVNTADPAVLVACLADLSGWVYLEGSHFHRDEATGLPDYDRPGPDTVGHPDRYRRVDVDVDAARRLADRLVARRAADGPFRTFDAVRRCLDEAVADGDLTAWQAAVAWAQILPDARLEKFSPDGTLHGGCDKSDLIDWTTEFCLSSMGRYEIESFGRVVDDRGESIASARVDTTLQVYEVRRDTTATDFLAGRRGPDLPDGRPAVAVHPELPDAPDTGYDGRLGLAPVHPRPRLHPTLHATFDPFDPAWSPHLIDFGTEVPIVAPLVGDPSGEAMIDGVFSEAGRFPAFATSGGGISDRRGALAFWFRPDWDLAAAAPRPHAIIDLNGAEPDSTFQVYYDTRRPAGSDKGPPRPLIGFLAWDAANERRLEIEVDLSEIAGPREWIFVTLTWSGDGVVLEAQGPKSAGSTYDLSNYSFYGLPLSLEARGPGWVVVPGPGLDFDYFLSQGTLAMIVGSVADGELLEDDELIDKTRGGCGRIIPWPRPNPVFKDPESAIRFLDSLLEKESGGVWKSQHYHNVKTTDGDGTTKADTGEFERVGESALVGIGSVHPRGTEEFEFRFGSDPTTALRLGGPIKVGGGEKFESPSWVEAGANGLYSDLLVYANPPAAASGLLERTFEEFYQAGRYYKGGDAWFESRDLGIAPGTRLGTVHWTAHRPAGSGGFEIEVAGVRSTDPAAGVLGLSAPAETRYRVRFVDVAGIEHPLLRTPYLDSVTITALTPVVHLTYRVVIDGTPTPWRGSGP